MRSEPTPEEIREARHVAIDAAFQADELEAEARQARRHATAAMKHYEDLLLITQGQQTLPYDSEGF